MAGIDYSIVDPVEFLKQAMENAYYGMAPSEFLSVALPWLTYGSNYNLSQQQMEATSAAQAADTAARIQAASIGAGASVQGAEIDARAKIQAAQISVQGQLKAIDAQIKGDLQKAQMGLEVDVNQFNANLKLQADLQNQNMRLEVAKLGASTGWRDALSARLFVEGTGPQPGVGSAFLAGPMQEVSASSVPGPVLPTTPASPRAAVRSASPAVSKSFGGDILMADPMSGMTNAGESYWAPSVTPTVTSPPRSYIPPGFAKGTGNAGKAFLVGEGRNLEGLRQGTAEILRLAPNGKVEVIPLAGLAAGGYVRQMMGQTQPAIPAAKPPGMSARPAQYTVPPVTPAEVPVTPAKVKPALVTAAPITPSIATPAITPAPSLEETGRNGGTVTATPASPVATPAAPALSPAFSALSNTPALQAARTGVVPPAFQQYGGPVDIGFGLGELPEPAKVGSMFMRLNPQYQEDLLQAYETAGIPRVVALYQMAHATPGWRTNPQRAFKFA